MWKCLNCGKEYDELPERLSCTHCKKKIFVKVRPKIVKKVKAI